jgi:hypothetical protein
MKYPNKLASLPLIAAFMVVSANHARAADPAPKTSVVDLVDNGQRWLVAATLGPTVASDPTTRSTADAPTAERARLGRAPDAEHEPLFDLSPNASIVARDWRGSMKIVGARTMLVDNLRPTASNRMVMGRIATDAKVSLFAQVGAGEWRIDTVMFPNTPSYSEIAGQVGGGFEARITPRFRFAGEVQYTILHRDLSYAAGEVAPLITSCVFAIDGRF